MRRSRPHSQYKNLKSTWEFTKATNWDKVGSPRNYLPIQDTWTEQQILPSQYIPEKFFMSYALNGQIVDPQEGLRTGIPTDYPLKNSPVKEPSPLNTRWKYNPGPVPLAGIL